METSQSTSLQKTPLYDNHVTLGARMAPFGGWIMPIQYEGILAEHAYTRTAVSVFDICHMGEFLIEADPVATGLDRIVTQNIVSMPIGACRYGFMLNERGGIVDDLIVYRKGKVSWMFVVNAATITGDEKHMHKHLCGKYGFVNVSQETGKLDIQGPESKGQLIDIFGSELGKLRYYTFGEFDFDGERCIISRTGYTGELGYEIYVSAGRVSKLWDLLLKDKRIKPAGLGCRDTLRLEMGYPLSGQDIGSDRTPLAAGFGKFVDFDKDFIGKIALSSEMEKGPKDHLVCFKTDSRRAPRHGFAIISEGKRVGTVTSGSFSPSLSSGIGMGYITCALKVGAPILIKESNLEINAQIVDKPFYRKA